MGIGRRGGQESYAAVDPRDAALAAGAEQLHLDIRGQQRRLRLWPALAVLLAVAAGCAYTAGRCRWAGGARDGPFPTAKARFTHLFESARDLQPPPPPGAGRQEEPASASLLADVAGQMALAASARQWVMTENINIWCTASLSADTCGHMGPCDIASGRELENGWVELMDRAGFIKPWHSGKTLAQQLHFERISSGRCPDYGLFEVPDAQFCKVAADGLGIHMFNVTQQANEAEAGCFCFDSTALWLALNAASEQAFSSRKRICSSQPECVPPSAVTSTTVATTTSLKTEENDPQHVAPESAVRDRFEHRQYPTLFCWLLTMMTGYEPQMVKEQYKLGLSIFRCDGYAVYSDEVMDLGEDLSSKGLGGPRVESDEGDWGSWSNSEVFLQVWKLIIDEGAYRNFDWVVKVDPDTVFHPTRLKLHVVNISSGDMVYMQNCIGYPTIGALEVFTTKAIEAYAQSIKGDKDARSQSHPCYDLVEDTAEDFFICNCLELLGVEGRRDLELLRHEKPGGCDDDWIVAFHPYKVLENYTECALSAE